MMVCTSNKKKIDGVWVGRMTNEQRKNGGIWVIGNTPYDSAEDYPGKNAGEFLVKSWVATPERYGSGQYPFKDRREESMWEYVRVFSGELICTLRSPVAGEECLYRLSSADEGTDIPPDFFRKWELPSGIDTATGITLIHQPALTDPAYIFSFWDGLEDDETLKPESTWQYIEVFSGQLLLQFQEKQQSLQEGNHIFVPPGIPFSAHISEGSRGVQILYKS